MTMPVHVANQEKNGICSRFDSQHPESRLIPLNWMCSRGVLAPFKSQSTVASQGPDIADPMAAVVQQPSDWHNVHTRDLIVFCS